MEWLLIILAGLLLAGKKTVEIVETTIDKTTNLGKITLAALPVSKESGIPLIIIVTQAVHESGYGASFLAQKGMNLFGIKATSAWIGATIELPTHEVINGQEIAVKASFRKYSTWEASVRDWLKFIQGARYSKAYAAALAGDSALFFSELQRAGYATDPNYASKLVGVLNKVKEAIA